MKPKSPTDASAERARPTAKAPAMPPESASSRAYALLRTRISTLELVPGQALSERDVAQELGASRMPVHEAVLRLAEEGLLDIYPRVGTFVAPIRLPAVLQAAFVRESLECSIVRVLALRRRSAFVQELQAAIERQDAAVQAGDAAAFFEEDERMHRSFAAEAGHEPVRRVIEEAKIHVDRARRLKLPEDLRMRVLVREHQLIAKAIEAQDADAAHEAMHEHLDGLVRGLAGLAKRYPEYFDNGSGRPARAPLAAIANRGLVGMG